MLTDEEARLLEDAVGFDADALEEDIEAAIAGERDERAWSRPAFELGTMARVAKGLLALWRAERAQRLAHEERA